MIELPLSLRDISPHPDAIRLTGIRDDGLPDGVHTGGAWLCPDDTVWKPLDARPYPNAEYLVNTLEVECLTAFQGKPMFPKNWVVKEANGRKFLVRNRAWVFTRQTELLRKEFYVGYSRLPKKQILEVEQGLRILNQAGWEINDPLTIAWDMDQIFFLDLSAAWTDAVQHINTLHLINEEWRVIQFFEDAGYKTLAWLRKNAPLAIQKARRVKAYRFTPKHRHVYSSHSRPLNYTWIGSSIPGDYCIVDGEYPVHSWLLSQEPLTPEICYRFELEWAWSPMHTYIEEVL
jgi:hypothetical protein